MNHVNASFLGLVMLGIADLANLFPSWLAALLFVMILASYANNVLFYRS